MTSPATDTAGCFHCGEPLPSMPARARIDGEQRAFCCDGCAAAAAWIRDAHLDDYYRLRSANANRVGTADPDYAAWDRADVQAGHASTVPGGQAITVLTDGMHCAACAWLIDHALRREPGVLDCGANAITGRVRIAWDPQRTPLSRLLARMAALGYRPYLATGADREGERRRDRNRWLLRLGIAGLGAMQAMMFAEALYLDFDNQMGIATRDFLRWIAVLVSTPVVFYAGWPFIAGMLREVRARRLGMDTLIAGSALLAWAASVIETLRGGPHVWFDAAVMFVFLLLLARLLEQRARQAASARVDALARATPALATREQADGRCEQVPQALLAVDDVLRVAPGEAVPADGVLLDAAAAVDEALLTGESTPVRKQAGDALFAGSVCRDTPLRLRVTGAGGATRLSQLVRLVEQAQTRPMRLALLADRIAAWFVPALLLCAAGIWAWWHWQQPDRAFEVMLAVLVVSCPCALTLAIPAALAVAQGSLSRLGVLVLQGDAIDTLADADRIVFDKTGTLTAGRLQIAGVQITEEESGITPQQLLQIAAALQRDNTHPIAAAFAEVATPLQATDIRQHPGLGVQGWVDGRSWTLGQRAFAAADHVGDDAGIWLGDGRRAVAHIRLQEAERGDAADAVAALQELGLDVDLCSGDAEPVVRDVAQRLGIADWRARQSPEDKLQYVQALQRHGSVVAMVGDGINDAPVLAAADVSIALSDGAALAQRAADFVMVSSSLLRVPQTVALARRTRRIIRENLAWALVYNVIALPLAAAGWVTPWLAALGMALSSLLVTLNALRLGRLTPLHA